MEWQNHLLPPQEEEEKLKKKREKRRRKKDLSLVGFAPILFRVKKIFRKLRFFSPVFLRYLID